ncbi:MAG: hypothetical protein HYR91_03070, partial [Flavobacteriia bacterium]|nr:hypothetical protein [Flavobacteriia bacterium]
SCKKKSHKDTEVNFHVFNPVTGEGAAGVKVGIVRLKEKMFSPKFGDLFKSELLDSAYTDNTGRATIKFKAYNNSKYSYFQFVTHNFTADKYMIQQPDFNVAIVKNSVNNYEYKYTVQDNLALWIKNINYFDENDNFF